MVERLDRHQPPAISVVIPAYDAERFLDETLASVAAQTFQSMEVVVVDDGSEDGTPAIIEKWLKRDERIRSVRTENRGVARARNLGLTLAAGEFVAFLDADDIWHPDKLHLQHAMLLAAGTDCAACYALYRTIDIDGRVLRNTPVATCSGYIFARHLLIHLVGNGSSLLVRRDAALAVGGYDPSYAAEGIGGCEDLDFELRLARRYKIASVPAFLIGYRRYPGNMSSDRRRMVKAMARTIERGLANGPAVPRFVERGASVAILEYAITAYLVERDYLLAAKSFLHLCGKDPRTAARAAGWIARAVRTKLARRWSTSPQLSSEAGVRFADVAPDEGLTKALPPHITRRLESAQAVDESLWLKLTRELSGAASPMGSGREDPAGLHLLAAGHSLS